MTPGVAAGPGCLCQGHLFVPVRSPSQPGCRIDVIALPRSASGEAVHIASYELPSGMHPVGINTATNVNSTEDLGAKSALLAFTIKSEWLLVTVDALTRSSVKHASVLVDGCMPWVAWGPQNTRKLIFDRLFEIFGNTVVMEDKVVLFNPYDVARNIYPPETSVGSRRVTTALSTFLGRDGADRAIAANLPCWESHFSSGHLDSLLKSEYDFFHCVEDQGPKVRCLRW